MERFDLIIVGTGSGNGMPAELDGWRIALVERGVFGGTCLNRGCIPSKMFVYAADIAVEVDGDDLIVYYGNGDDSIRVQGFKLGDPAQNAPFEIMQFADGAQLRLTDLLAAGIGIYGTPGMDALHGGPGADNLFGFVVTDD